MLDVMLVGTGGMTPLPKRWLASLLVRLQGRLLLVDCGEGTQISLKMVGWGFKEISTILISHLHADHTAGLPGLLLSIGNSGRREPVTLYGPEELTRLAQGVHGIAPQLPFPLEWRQLSGGERFEAEGLEISCLAADHGVPCLAYSLHLPRTRRFLPEKANQLGLPVRQWGLLQAGEPVEWEGRWVRPEEVLGEERPGIKLSYVTDTRPTSALPAFVEGSDLLICEGMYGSPEELPKALAHKHMLFSEAAELARAGHVRELWLTHYSPSLSNPEDWLDQATRVFPNASTGQDHMTATLRFQLK